MGSVSWATLYIQIRGWPRKHLTPVPQAGKVLFIFICEIPMQMKFSGHFNHVLINICQKFLSILIKYKWNIDHFLNFFMLYGFFSILP